IGNAELKARLDLPGKLTVAGERLHVWLLRRFYAAHGYQTMWDAHPAEAGRLVKDAVLHAGEHGLDPGLVHSGALGERGPERAAAAEHRVRQLAINLERLRWLPRQMPRDRVVVNAAIARLQLFRDDRPVFTTRVVVGETDKQTPEFQSTINDVLFNPPWNIP